MQRLVKALIALLALGALCWLPLAAATELRDVRIWQNADTTRVVLDFDGSLEHKAFTLANPHRLVMDLRNTQRAKGLKLDQLSAGPVAAIRSGLRPEGMRLVLDLTGPVQFTSFGLEANAEYGYRLVFDLRSGTASPPPFTGAGPLAPPPNLPQPPAVIAGPIAPTLPVAPSPVIPPPVIAPVLERGTLEPLAPFTLPPLYAVARIPRAYPQKLGKFKPSPPPVVVRVPLPVVPVEPPPPVAIDPPVVVILPPVIAPAIVKPIPPPVAITPPPVVPTPPSPPVLKPEPRRSADSKVVVVAIDAGHGGRDPGAHGANGTLEKDVCLQISRRLAQLFNNTPGYRAVLTRSGDQFLELRERTAVARKAEADIFISIHANSMPVASQKRGSAVYVLSQRGASSEHAKMLARLENSADQVGGVPLKGHDEDLASVLLDISQTAVREASFDLGARVLNALSQQVTLQKRDVQQAAFAVLKSPDMPAILVETAFLSDPRDEAMLANPDRQQGLASALYNGVRSYFSAYRPQSMAGSSTGR